MATFLRNQRKKNEVPTKTVVNGTGPESKTSEPDKKIFHEEKADNNTTEYEYMRSMFADLMSTMPLTPVARRAGRIGRQPQGSEACRVMVAANQANIKFSLSFNKADSAGCASTYQKGALMEARPNGIVFGRKMVESFWSSVHSGKPGPIRYTNMRMRVIDEDTVTFASDWTFNTMRGIIMLETWRKMPDGTYELDEDRFKIEELYSSPRIASLEEEVLGLRPCYIVNEVMDAMAKRIDTFTNGDVEGFVNSYTQDSLLTVDPLANNNGQDQIRKFISPYIQNRKKYGNGVFTCNNFSVKVIDTRTVHISGDWDLGGRDNEGSIFGYINCQRYVRQPDGKWLIALDDWTLEPTEFLY